MGTPIIKSHLSLQLYNMCDRKYTIRGFFHGSFRFPSYSSTSCTPKGQKNGSDFMNSNDFFKGICPGLVSKMRSNQKNKGTLYHYFSDLTSLILETWAELLNKYC